ncbi:hypothetical protein BOTBODRAFT_638489 [Botryobasidium botryosum FD-172 SS1]|uniref:Uncharacterized protein n=1 Tax=Botryobasidium botryosum (strain FD-172 SS1) TaxID=930990 RepID=A0A067M5Q3_BOTB1|nr:hypothetical protein BOTBODRAFT_638489 [Botryobasidium botryosum FD-172 SS1]
MVWDFRMGDPAFFGHWMAYGQLRSVDSDNVNLDRRHVGKVEITAIELRHGPLTVDEILLVAFGTFCVVRLVVSVIGCAIGIAVSIVTLPFEVAGWLFAIVWFAFMVVRWFASVISFVVASVWSASVIGFSFARIVVAPSCIMGAPRRRMNVPTGILEVFQSHLMHIAQLLPVHALIKMRLGDDTPSYHFLRAQAA